MFKNCLIDVEKNASAAAAAVGDTDAKTEAQTFRTRVASHPSGSV